jgi:hypothetical protein
MLKGLVVGAQDIRYPIHGSARLALAVLHALALNGHRVHYVASWGNARNEVTEVTTRSRFGESSIFMVKMGRPRGSLSLLNVVVRVLGCDYDYVLCLDRWLTLPCKSLSTKLDVPLITYMDSPKYLHLERLATIKDRFLRPMALAWYATVSLLSNATICVSKYIEDRLGRWGVRAATVEPSYALLRESDGSVNDDDGELSEVGDDALLCSCPLELTTLIALRNPDVPVVVTGPQAYYLREYLKVRGLANELRNLHLLHNIRDGALEKLHDKIAASLIARPALAGLSMTLIQELYFGKAIMTDANTASRIRGLTESKAVIINDEYAKWPATIKELMKRSCVNELGVKARKFFDDVLSPKKFARSFECILHYINPFGTSCR